MPCRSQGAKKRTVQLEISSDDDAMDLGPSQQSNSSDDHRLQLVLEEHFAAAREKKKREQARKFSKAAHKRLAKDIGETADELKASMSAVETLFTELLEQYAANEDEIHKVWAEIQKEQQSLAGYALKHFELNSEVAVKRSEGGQTPGLLKIKNACRENREVINRVTVVSRRG